MKDGDDPGVAQSLVQTIREEADLRDDGIVGLQHRGAVHVVPVIILHMIQEQDAAQLEKPALHAARNPPWLVEAVADGVDQPRASPAREQDGSIAERLIVFGEKRTQRQFSGRNSANIRAWAYLRVKHGVLLWFHQTRVSSRGVSEGRRTVFVAGRRV